MANVLHRITKQFLPSQNEPDFSLTNWIHNPDLSAVAGFSAKYWVITGDAVTLMDQASRDAVDAAEIDAQKDSLSTNIDRVVKALILSINDGSFIPNTNYTNLEIKNIIKAKL